MQVETLLTRNIVHADPCRQKNTWSRNKDGTWTLRYSSLEESYFWALTQSFIFSILGYKLF